MLRLPQFLRLTLHKSLFSFTRSSTSSRLYNSGYQKIGQAQPCYVGLVLGTSKFQVLTEPTPKIVAYIQRGQK